MDRGALERISIYGSDSSDEEVPIGRVSTKRNYGDISNSASNKKVKTSKLPLPQIIGEETEDTQNDVPIDDPSMHGGRIRSFPHERGNWVTYVYIPYEPPDTVLAEMTDAITGKLPNLQLQPVDHYHISLTKTVILRHHWIESFMQTARERISRITRFVIVFGTLNVYCNEERTRTFIGLEIRSGYDTLINLVNNLDMCLAEFQLPAFYQNPSFHMSILWCVGDHEAEINSVLPQLRTYVENEVNIPHHSWYNAVTHLECKSGNKLFILNLLDARR